MTAAFKSFVALEERFQLYAGGRSIGEIVRRGDTDETLFFHADALGSIDTVSTSGNQVIHQDFEPFGEPLGSTAFELTRAGFTGHQHDPDLGLIDMRGRVYDPLASRFLTPDPVTQAPFWSQGLNRYSYVFNDPINLTDPTGFSANDTMSDIVRGFVMAGHVGAVGLSSYGFTGGMGSFGVATGFGGLNLVEWFFNPFGGTAPRQTSVTSGTGAPNSGPPTQCGLQSTGQAAEAVKGQEARQGNTYRQYPSDFLSDAPDPVPGTVDPAEPLADPYVRMEMRRALEESHPSGKLKDSKEQGGWIVKRAGGYRVIRWDDSTATYNSIDRPSGKPPKGTAAAFHTHRLDPGSASPQDWDIAQNDAFPNYIVGPYGVYRLTNMQQSFLGPLGGGSSGLFPWIVLGAGVAGGTAAYCHFHGC